MSYAVFFGVLAATSLVAALGALWGSLRAALGGQVATGFSTADTPERAALLDEKTALLRAIKDLSYEHQVGKLDKDDYERLDRAYRARAKEVLELLDRDVRPYRAKAEALLEAELGGTPRKKKRKVGKPVEAAESASATEPAEKPAADEPATEAAASEPEKTDLAGAIEALDPEKRAKAEAFLRELAQAPAQKASEGEARGDAEGDDDEEEEEAST